MNVAKLMDAVGKIGLGAAIISGITGSVLDYKGRNEVANLKERIEILEKLVKKK